MIDFFYFVIAFVVVLTLHEFAHAWMANYLGDPTAKFAGRISLNPVRHLDLMGTLLLIFAGLGWGKPVPIDPRNFEKPIRDSSIVSFAGPFANLVLAFAASVPYKYFYGSVGVLGQFGDLAGAIFQLSIILFAFNLLPFPPLDGSKVLWVFIPARYQMRYQRFLMEGWKYFLIFVLIDNFFLQDMLGFSVIWGIVSYIYAAVSTGILAVS